MAVIYLGTIKVAMYHYPAHNKSLVRMQTTLRFVCAVQLKRYVSANANAKVYMQILKANKLNKMNLKEKTL